MAAGQIVLVVVCLTGGVSAYSYTRGNSACNATQVMNLQIDYVLSHKMFLWTSCKLQLSACGEAYCRGRNFFLAVITATVVSSYGCSLLELVFTSCI